MRKRDWTRPDSSAVRESVHEIFKAVINQICVYGR